MILGAMQTNSQFSALAYAVRGRVCAKHIGQLCLVQSVLMLPPLLVAVITGSQGFALRCGAAAVAVFGVGLALRRIRAPSKVQRNEALVISAMAFLLSPLVLAFSTMAFGLSFVDALFEAVSGITTTGLTTLASVEDKPAALHFLRAWTQWYGGLGIVVLTLALLIRPGPSIRRLSAVEFTEDDLVGGIRAHARQVLLIYIGLTAFGMAATTVAGVPVWSGLLHVLAGVSTGGFSSLDTSLAGLGGWVERVAVMFVSLSGAVCLSVYYRVMQGRRRLLVTDGELQLLFVLAVVVSGLLLAGLLLDGSFEARGSWPEAVGHALVMGFSAQTTTGYASMPCSELSTGSKLIVALSMFIGGSLGSTAGGIKIVRLLVLFRLLQALFHQVTLPAHAVTLPRAQGKRVEPSVGVESLLTIFLFVFVNVASWSIFLAAGYDPMDSLFDVVSATGTVGLSTGVVSAELPAYLKGVLCFDMLAGRLEVLALLVVLYPRTWIGRRRRGHENCHCGR